MLSGFWHYFSDWYRLNKDKKGVGSDSKDPWAGATSEMDFSDLKRTVKHEGEVRAVKLPQWLVKDNSLNSLANNDNSRNRTLADRGGLQIVLLDLNRDPDVEISRIT